MDSTIQSQLLQLLKDAIPIIWASQFMTISGVTVFAYDYLLTLADEIDLIWGQRASTISVIFLANRYMVPLVLAVDIFDRFGLNPNPSVLFCKIWIWMEAYIMIASFMSMHALVAMRVHALHGGSKTIKWILLIAGAVYGLSTAGILAVALWARNDQLRPAPYFHICFEVIAPFLWTVWLPSLGLEGLLFVLTLWKAYEEARRHAFSPITAILFRDGILYFFAISGCSVLSMFIWLYGTPLMVGLAKYWAFAMVNVAGSRLVLNLKSHARAIQRVRTGLGDRDTHSSFGHDPMAWQTRYQYIDLEHYPTAALGTIFPSPRVTNFEAL